MVSFQYDFSKDGTIPELTYIHLCYQRKSLQLMSDQLCKQMGKIDEKLAELESILDDKGSDLLPFSP